MKWAQGAGEYRYIITKIFFD